MKYRPVTKSSTIDMNNPKILRLTLTLKRCGAIHIVLGLGLAAVSLAAVGIDRGYVHVIENSTKVGNETLENIDPTYYLLGLDIVSLVCSIFVSI